MRAEVLRRGQAPFLLPTAALRAGVPSASALRALSKRTLYPPAGWPEELDDQTKTQGVLTVTFTGSLPGGGEAVLVGRVKVSSGRTPADSGYGSVVLLGHNPARAGWQPFLLPLRVELTPDFAVTVNIDAPLSRLLLARGSTADQFGSL